MKIGKILNIAIIALLLIATIYLLALYNLVSYRTILEKEFIFSYRLETISQNPKIIKLSGVCGDSALSIEHIYTKTEGKTLTIYIRLIFAPKNPDFSGNLEYLLQIPDNIDTIQLGENKVIIWERNKFNPK